ncbi:hypothetical protein M3649_20760 [Ureibacillus chungkukjangi]|uniref:hypothetical protein n=1 Tax=Ureibacillus chungkukjangi TaxID=1202712 RepID=UPI00203D7701|nr:hypothetical protein [Ureibacillus chungkukjangi]MCM3390519.1 hypothetical protein [Ureibacillus chungkukjangi]
MLSELLWVYGAKRQYDMQKENGLAGIFGILSVIFIIWQWDTIFYPLFKAIGLVDIFSNAGLFNENMSILTVINVLATIVLILFLAAVITAIPMFLIILILNVFGNYDSERPNAIHYAFAIVLFPIGLLLYALFIPLQAMGIVSKPQKSLRQHVKEDAQMMATYKNNIVPLKSESALIAELYAIQQSNLKDPVEARPLSYEETVKVLNRAVLHLEESKDYVFAFSETKKQWYLLLNNPVPVFASKIIRDDRPEVSPFNYESLYKDFSMYSDYKYEAYRGHYYAPAVALNFSWDYAAQLITLKLHEGPNSTILDVETFTNFVQLDGESVHEFYKKAINVFGVQSAVDRAHAYAYILPIAYPVEEKRFLAGETYPSYYRELQKVPNVYKLAPDFKELAIEYIQRSASFNQSWAKDYLANCKSRKEEV